MEFVQKLKAGNKLCHLTPWDHPPWPTACVLPSCAALPPRDA